MSMANAATTPLLASSQDAEPAKEPSIDDVMEMYIGATGILQLLKSVLVSFAWAFDAQQVFITAFTDAEQRWHCLAASTGNSSCSSTAATPCALLPGAWAWDRPAEASVVSEWALSCAGPALVSLLASSFFAGCLAGGFLLTTLPDSLGRKRMLLVSLVSMAIAAVLTIWTAVPCLCYSSLVYFLVPESPRWLLVRGRKLDAVEALKQINGSCATASFSLLDGCTMREDNDAGASRAGGVFAALQAMWERRWALRRLGAIMAASFGVGMVYFGMPLNVGSLGSNLYLSITFNALAEMASAALTWLLISRSDRRGSVIALTAAAGACSLACVAIPRRAAAARMAAEVLSFFATCTAFDVLLIYSTEMFPTSVRNSAVGLVRQTMVLGGGAAPVLIALVGRGSSFWSFGVFGIAIGCSGIFVPCLPETRGKRMSDTMEEEERNEAAVRCGVLH